MSRCACTGGDLPCPYRGRVAEPSDDHAAATARWASSPAVTEFIAAEAERKRKAGK
jgi:hypothetical protein